MPNINEAENVFQWRSSNEGLYSFFDVIKQTLQWSLCDHSSVHTNLMGLCASAVMWLTGRLHAMDNTIGVIYCITNRYLNTIFVLPPFDYSQMYFNWNYYLIWQSPVVNIFAACRWWNCNSSMFTPTYPLLPNAWPGINTGMCSETPWHDDFMPWEWFPNENS